MAKDSASFEVSGFGDLFGQLKELDEKVGVRALMGAGRRAMAPVEEHQKQNAREDTGALKASIATRSAKYGGRDVVAVILVGPLKRFDGKGSAVRGLTNVALKTLEQEYGNQKTEADPFIRPSLENNQQVVISGLVDEFSRSFTRIKKRQAKKAGK